MPKPAKPEKVQGFKNGKYSANLFNIVNANVNVLVHEMTEIVQKLKKLG